MTNARVFFLIITCMFRRREIKTSSVAELCDLSCYDELVASNNYHSCGNTSTTTTLKSAFPILCKVSRLLIPVLMQIVAKGGHQIKMCY